MIIKIQFLFVYAIYLAKNKSTKYTQFYAPKKKKKKKKKTTTTTTTYVMYWSRILWFSTIIQFILWESIVREKRKKRKSASAMYVQTSCITLELMKVLNTVDKFCFTNQNMSFSHIKIPINAYSLLYMRSKQTS